MTEPMAMAQSPKIFDRALVQRRLARADANETDFVTKLVLDDLAERLGTITRTFTRAAIIGPRPAALPEMGSSAEGTFAYERIGAVTEGVPALAATDYGLIVSVLDLQWVDDVPAYLTHIFRHLAPDGLFVAALIGGRSLTELRQAWLAADSEISGGASPRVAPMIDVRDAGGLLQHAGFALPVADLETHVVRYASPLALMAEIKALGAANPLAERSSKLVTPTLFATAATTYADRFSDPDGRIRATLEILWLSGWSPHESQQKPLKPGSATKSLRDVLGDKG